MKKENITYVQAIKNHPGALLHLAVFFVAVLIPSYGVWGSMPAVFPEGADMGHISIVGSCLAVLIIMFVSVKATPKVRKRAAYLAIATAVCAWLQFGGHWLLKRDLSMANRQIAVQKEQKTFDDQLADKNAARSKEVLDSLTNFNRSQAQMSSADRELYRSTGIKRVRRAQEAPSLNDLGILVKASPTPAPAAANPVQTNALAMGGMVAPSIEPQAEILSVDKVYLKWQLPLAFLALLESFISIVGTTLLAFNWEWDRDGNGINDAEEYATGKA